MEGAADTARRARPRRAAAGGHARRSRCPGSARSRSHWPSRSRGAHQGRARARAVPVRRGAARRSPGSPPASRAGWTRRTSWALAAPMSSVRLLLLRTVAVLGATLALTAIGALALPGPGAGRRPRGCCRHSASRSRASRSPRTSPHTTRVRDGQRRLAGGDRRRRDPARRTRCAAFDGAGAARVRGRDRGGGRARARAAATTALDGSERAMTAATEREQAARAHAGAARAWTFGSSAGVTGLLGPNGAGKTTLMRILATVLAPDAGTVRLLGRDPRDADERTEIRRRLGYMPQEPGFHARFTAFEFVDYVAILKEHDRPPRPPRRGAAGARRWSGCSDVGGKRIRALSGGMRRRVALAQALLGDPRPADPRRADRRARPRAAAAVPRVALRARPRTRDRALSTHQTEDVAALCPRVVVLAEGRVLVRRRARRADRPRARPRVARRRTATPARRRRLAHRRTGGQRQRGRRRPPAPSSSTPTLEDGYLLLLEDHACVPA